MTTLQKRETILFGGAFNPPTLAHTRILQACIEYARERDADVWLMPSGDRRDKTITTDRDTRLAYIKAMIFDADPDGVDVQILLTELDRPIAVETYDTAVELDEMYPDRSFRWVFGADSTETMADWKGGDWILEHLDKLVIERAGSVINPLAKRAEVLVVDTPNVSSTEVRRRIADGEPIDRLVGPKVLAIIV